MGYAIVSYNLAIMEDTERTECTVPEIYYSPSIKKYGARVLLRSHTLIKVVICGLEEVLFLKLFYEVRLVHL